MFLFGPIILAAAGVLVGANLESAEALLAAVAILAGLLFSLLIMLLSMANAVAMRAETDGLDERIRRRVRVLKEISANVAYSVLVAVACTVLLTAGQISLPKASNALTGVLQHPIWFSFFSLVALTHLLLTLIMIVKRTYLLLAGELEFAGVPSTRA